MNKEKIESYFKEKTKDISFLEVKENQGQIGINTIPVLLTDLMEDISSENLEEKIKGDYILNGMINIIGADPDFKYNPSYLKILEESMEELGPKLLKRGIEEQEKGKLLNGGIIFRALMALDNKDLNYKFNYGLNLEAIGQKLIDEDEEEAYIFLEEAKKIFEEILNIDKSYSLAHYKLGYYYKNENKFLKAGITWNNYLKYGNDENLLQEVREQLEIIKVDEQYETALTYIEYGRYEEGINILLSLLPKYEEYWNINFLMAKGFLGLEDYENVLKYIDKTEEILIQRDEYTRDFKGEIYNTRGACYLMQGNPKKAIEILSNAININPHNYASFVNRFLAYVEINDLENAKKDLEFAYTLNPEDETILYYMNSLKN